MNFNKFINSSDFNLYWSNIYSSKLNSLFSNPEHLLFNKVSDYLSAASIVQCYDSVNYSDKGYWILSNLRVQSFLNDNTNEVLKEVYNLASLSNDNRFFNDNFFFNSNFFNENTASSFNLLDSTHKLSEEIKYVSEIKNDFETLSQFFPKYYETFEIFDILTPNDDNSLYEDWSTPDFKLYYPEPFIASPSFVHEQFWFIHILHYNHWLWFMFISLIMFYFITFINVVRWCNPRNRPKRETRGVSRSKCADLITASVPVSWATSIIISETVDASDYYDGFGTGELVVGIRAYQWGWEYYYPRGLDLNYNVNPTYSASIGNSLKYTTSSLKTAESNTFWKNMNNNSVNKVTSTPSHLILSPTDNNKILNFLDFNSIGSNSLDSATAFKKIQSFSKTNPQELFNTSSEFNLKYNKLSNLYKSDTDLLNSTSYGTFRQHNFNSKSSLTNQFTTNLDEKSVDKLVSYNYNLASSVSNPALKSESSKSSVDESNLSNLNNSFNSMLNSSVNYDLGKLVNYPSITNVINQFTDSKSFKNPFKYALGDDLNKQTVLGSDLLLNNFSNGEIQNFSTNLNNSNKSLNSNLSYSFTDAKSAGQQLLASDRNPRLAFNLFKSNFNLDDYNTNTSQLVNNDLGLNMLNKQETLFNLSNLNWGKTSVLSKLLDNNLSYPSNHIPAIANNSNFDVRSFSRFTDNSSSPSMMRSKEESAPNFIFETYWLNLWANTNLNKRLGVVLDTNLLLEENYLPNFTEYADYDFRNWQTLELLEDAFWESTYSSFTQDDYVNTLQNLNDYKFFKKQEEIFNVLNRSKKFKANTLSKPLVKDLTLSTNLNVLPTFTEDALPNTNLLSLQKFTPFSLEVTTDSLDDSYENTKNLNYLHHLNYINTLNLTTLGMQPLSYANVLNTFRPDYDESTWSLDSYLSNDVSNQNFIDLNDSSELRFSNPLKLRSTAKNSIVTYSAIQKVFKSRFDEGRSNARLQDISNSYNKHLFISEPKSSYESLLGKNKDSFFSINNYNQELTNNFNDIVTSWNTLNTYFIDLPFLMSTQSDPSRFLWFDWQSRWSSLEVQPSSVSRYSLAGLPYSTKNFEYSTQLGDNINESETYLIRIARARKNYMSNWAFTPYFYTRVSNWYKVNTIFNPLMADFSISSIRLSLELASNYWEGNISNNDSYVSTPSYSGTNTPNRSSIKPESSLHSEIYNISILVDLLTKREYLYREYFLNKGYAVNLPNYLTSSPNNPLVEEVKKSYPFIDPSSFGSELSREFFYQNSNFVQFNLIKNFLNTVTNNANIFGLNLSSLNNYLFFYLFDNTEKETLGSNSDLYKNQFRPIRKGITNMIRLHATGAIAMPIEIRLHILASSRDVIHSWAIPSAGIKIDCVPGFSTHRVAIFLLSGIFWGQCMEICGRFHHWMPIIVYFMKRDLFFLWCTHFMHFSTDNNSFNSTDKQLSSQLRLVTFQKSLWLDEVSKSI